MVCPAKGRSPSMQINKFLEHATAAADAVAYKVHGKTVSLFG
jgi:hypothetical protein